MESTSSAPVSLLQADAPLELVIRLTSTGAVLCRERVTRSDLMDARAETWRENFLRAGHTQATPRDIEFRLLPIVSKSSRLCKGFAIQADPLPGGKGRKVFTSLSLSTVVSRAVDRLCHAGILQEGDAYDCDLDIAQSTDPAPVDTEAGGILAAKVKMAPYAFLEVPLPSLLEKARLHDPSPEMKAFPVIFSEEAFAQAESSSRKGAALNPNFESGAVLAGPLCTCPETGEFFIVIDSAFEVTGAEQTMVSLTYTGESWQRIQAVVKARQSVQPSVRLLGQAHGHNFLPNDGRVCAECAQKPVCDVTNVFVSSDDQTWTRAVFANQPWRICLIFGLSARADRIHGLFGLHDARLLRREFHVIPAFDAGEFPTKPTPGTN